MAVRRLLTVLVVAGLLGGWLVGADSAASAGLPAGVIGPAVSCASLATADFTGVPDAPSRIFSAKVTVVGGHSVCDVWGYLSPQTNFEITLPTAGWLGDYLQLGCGGFCGAVPNTTQVEASAGCVPVTNGGFVIAADDEGHLSPSPFDGLWGRDDPALRMVFGRTSEHALAQLSRAMIKRYYGRSAGHAYFDGCSDGGKEALVEAQRYPTDFNGIIAGAPALNWAPLGGESQTWLARANTDAAGHQILTAEKLPALSAAVAKACGDQHGIIADPRQCAFDPATLTCPAGQDRANCLTPAQVHTVRELYLGPTDPAGRSLYDGGEPYGSESAWQDWIVKPAADPAAPGDSVAAQLALNYLRYLGYQHNPPAGYALRDFAFTDDGFAQLEVLGHTVYNADDPDLHAFAAHGGKLIIYHGWADQAISPWSSLDYYAAVERDAGGFAASQRFSRLYLIPGANHCLFGASGTVSVDLLTPLINWVTGKGAPGGISAPLTQPSGSVVPQTVAPDDALAPVTPAPGSLNGSYHYIGGYQVGGYQS